MKQEGLITEEDYESKRRQLLTHLRKILPSLLPESITKDEDEKVEDLKELFDQGLITKDDYELKVKEIRRTNTQHFPDTSAEKELKTTSSQNSMN